MSVKSLREKIQGVSFDDVDEPSTPARAVDRPRTGPGAISASLALGRQVEEDNERLRLRNEQLEAAEAIQILDPETVGPSKYANRLEASFATPAFMELKNEIEAAGGNVQPIKVRKLDVPRGKILYEIAYGHRRHMSCLLSKLMVRAIVEPMTDEQLVSQMERENRGRENLTPWEQGVFYSKLIDAKLFPSIRRLADQMGVDHGLVSKAVQLASLPTAVVAAFPSPLELQFRWGALLQEAINRDEASVLASAAALAAAEPKPAAKQVLERLLSSSATIEAAKPLEFKAEGKGVLAIWEKNRRGGGMLRVKPGALSPAAERKLVEFLGKLLS